MRLERRTTELGTAAGGASGAAGVIGALACISTGSEAVDEPQRMANLLPSFLAPLETTLDAPLGAILVAPLEWTLMDQSTVPLEAKRHPLHVPPTHGELPLPEIQSR